MEEWKFLLQKDGDRSWLPLDSPDAEILEGRYRLVARSNQVNTDIGIRICHLATEEDPPKRRFQKRSSRTNENGLMVVMPFTYLRAGMWEISCFSTDPMSDLVGDTLHHTICLCVAAPVAEADLEDWSLPATDTSDLPTSAESSGEETEATPAAAPVPATIEVAQSGSVSMTQLLEMTTQVSHQVIEDAFRELQWDSAAATDAIVGDEPNQPAQSPSEATPSDSADGSPVQAADSVSPLNVSTLRLSLERTAFTASRGQVFNLAGQIVVDDLAQLETEIPAHWLETDAQEEDTCLTAESAATPASSTLQGVVAKELHLCLRDPQSSKILVREQQAFPCGVPPLNFSFSLTLPRTLATYLLLGEVVLYGSQPEEDEAPIALQIIPFTVTVDPENLVEELKRVNAALDKALLEDDSRGAELADLAVQFAVRLRQDKLKSPLDLSFLNLTTIASTPEEPPLTQPVSQPIQTGTTQVAVRPFVTTSPAQEALKQILPPRLQPSPERLISKKHLELPVFDRSSAVAPAPPTPGDSLLEDLFSLAEATPMDDGLMLQESGLQETGLEKPGLEAAPLEEAALEASPLEQPTLETAGLEEAPIAPAPSQPESMEPNQSATYSGVFQSAPLSIPEEDAASPIRSEFQALKLQERFLHRLTQLAEDAALMTALKQSLAKPATKSTPTAEKRNSVSSAPIFLESGAMATEIVVEDDLSWRDEAPRSPRRRLALNSNPAQNRWCVLPEDTPVPTPVVEVLTDEIIADCPMHLRVKLPDIAPRIAVKLWVSDRQTRTLLDGPRWLTDFSPNGFDQLETTLQITAPQGSLNVRVEAISVEIQTQRESQKIGLERSVTPAELPDLWDGDLGF